MRLVTVNLKGGTGKTTSAVYLALALARCGRTLLIDADPQQSALRWSELARVFPGSVADLVKGGCRAGQAASRTRFRSRSNFARPNI